MHKVNSQLIPRAFNKTPNLDRHRSDYFIKRNKPISGLKSGSVGTKRYSQLSPDEKLINLNKPPYL